MPCDELRHLLRVRLLGRHDLGVHSVRGHEGVRPHAVRDQLQRRPLHPLRRLHPQRRPRRLRRLRLRRLRRLRHHLRHLRRVVLAQLPLLLEGHLTHPLQLRAARDHRRVGLPRRRGQDEASLALGVGDISLAFAKLGDAKLGERLGPCC